MALDKSVCRMNKSRCWGVGEKSVCFELRACSEGSKVNYVDCWQLYTDNNVHNHDF